MSDDEKSPNDPLDPQAPGGEEPIPEQEVAAGDADTDGGSDEPPGPPPESALVAHLRRELAAKDQQLHDYIAAYKHAKAEMAAARDRLERDRKAELQRDRMKLAGAMLEVLDNFDRSVEGAKPGADVADVRQGLELVRQQFFSVLEGFGVQPMHALGGAFDAKQHEAVGMVPAQHGQSDQEVIYVERPGYLFDGKLLRAARVLIASQG